MNKTSVARLSDSSNRPHARRVIRAAKPAPTSSDLLASESLREHVLFGTLRWLRMRAEKPATKIQLASALAVNLEVVEAGLSHLRKRGLIQEGSLRLSMRGLMVVQALGQMNAVAAA